MSGAGKGALVILSGPSGVGKGTLIRSVCELRDDLAFSVSYTTRAPRPGEQDGKDYFFVTPEVFEAHRAAGDFLESAGYARNAYGTSNALVSSFRAAGKTALLDIEVQGAMQVRSRCPEAVLIYILPPDFPTLRDRLLGRHTESPDKVRERLEIARREAASVPEYDYVVLNDALEQAKERLNALLEASARRARGETLAEGGLLAACRPAACRAEIERYRASFPKDGEALL